jgi:sporulation protein YlmC with PRC-barrel domain
MEIQYGAEVVDKNEKYIGMVDYLVRNTYTGEISKFKVKTDLAESDLFFSPEDAIEVKPNRVKMNFSFDEGEQTT